MFDFGAFAIIVCVVLAAAAVESFFTYRRAWRRDARPAKLNRRQIPAQRPAPSTDDQAPYGTGTSLHL